MYGNICFLFKIYLIELSSLKYKTHFVINIFKEYVAENILFVLKRES